MNSSGIMTALKLGTSSEHRALESELNLMDPELTAADYVRTLQTFDAFVSAWEKWASGCCPLHLREFFAARRRAGLLHADLRYFKAASIAKRPDLPIPASSVAFLGSMYVMEGSTLGGQFISRHLESTLGLRDGDGYSYFLGHGAETSRMWKEFAAMLTQEAAAIPETEIVEAARQTFTAFRSFILLASVKAHS